MKYRALWKAKEHETDEWIKGTYMERLFSEWVEGEDENGECYKYPKPLGVIPQIHIGSEEQECIECYRIQPNTLCQCTGYKLVKDYEPNIEYTDFVYEHDIIKAHCCGYDDGSYWDSHVEAEVVFYNACWWLKTDAEGKDWIRLENARRGEIIGNTKDKEVQDG